MKKQYTKEQITEAIAYWRSELRRLDEEGRTEAERHLNSELAGDVMYGYGLPRGYVRDDVEDYVKEVDAETLAGWVRRGFVDPDIGEGYFDKDTEDRIPGIIRRFAGKHRVGIMAVAERDIELPPDDDPDAVMDSLDREIELARGENPAFAEAVEIFLAHKADGSPCLIALYSCDRTPRR